MTIPNQQHRHRRSSSRHSSSCNRHPSSTPSSGFCASCLRERLSLIDPLSLPDIPDPTSFLRTRSCSHPSRSFPPSEPRRNSCDSRSRNTLSDLFVVEDDAPPHGPSLVGVKEAPVEEEEERESRPPVRVSSGNGRRNVERPVLDVRQEVDGVDGEWKTVREFIDLECQSTKQKDRDAKGFWDVASAFSKKLRKWRHKESGQGRRGGGADGGDLVAGERGGGDAGLSSVGNMRAGVGDYGLGRRSCDTDPRHSVDAGRLSLDDIRSSIDKPRASLDGCLVGRGCQYPRLSSNPMVSFLEDVRVIHVGFRNKMLEDGKIDEVARKSPGGCFQTRDYYNDPVSVHRGRRNLDWLNSVRKNSLSEIDDRKLAMNAKISPAANELFYGAKLLITEEDLRESNSKSSADDRMEVKDGTAGVGDIDEKLMKKLHKWGKAWKVWDLIQRRNESKFSSEGSFPIEESGHQQGPIESEAVRKLRIVAQGEANDGANKRFIGARNSFHGDGPSLLGGIVENKSLGMNCRDELWQRHRNMIQSPNNLDNGLLRFYLTPARSYRTKHGRGKLRIV